MPKKHLPNLIKGMKALAEEAGVPFYIEPRYGRVAQLTTKRKAKRYFRHNSCDINTVGASHIARDKDYTAFFLKELGYPTIPGRAFSSPEWAETIHDKKRSVAAAIAYAKKLGYPLIVKPNSASQGVGVIKVYNQRELMTAVRFACSIDKVFLVQQVVSGQDYRIVVFDGKVFCAYRRRSFYIVGNGKATVRQLIVQKMNLQKALGRHTNITMDDVRLKRELKRSGYTLGSIVPSGEELALMPNANLSGGGDGENVTQILHPKWKTLSARIARDMGLRLVGIDVLVHEADLAKPPKDYTIIEVNALPGLSHFSTLGKKEKGIVEQLYRAMFNALMK